MQELILFNFTMDRRDPLLSHQYDVAVGLSQHFEKLTVITGKRPINELELSFSVISTNWKSNQKIRNVLRFYIISIPFLIRHRKNVVVFSHMTDVQSALIAPFTKILRIKHYLWYAHTKKSAFLKFASLFIDGIITSTVGSCPIRGSKVFCIGQAVDPKIFYARTENISANPNRMVHIGRLDPSKKIDEIIKSVSNLRIDYPDLTFSQIGSPSNDESEIKMNLVLEQYVDALEEGWLIFIPSVPRKKIPEILLDYDIFMHHYVGSLDKTLIEATMCKLPVLTLNPEYLSEFGGWGSGIPQNLEEEFRNFVSLSPSQRGLEISRRYRIAVARHSFPHWIESLSGILGGASQNKGV